MNDLSSPTNTRNTSPMEERNVRLLRRHWDWLDAQSRSADAGLRALVEEARQDKDGRHRTTQARETCYFYMRDMAGDRPQFEEAVRALFANDEPELLRRTAAWPLGIREGIASILGFAHTVTIDAGEP